MSQKRHIMHGRDHLPGGPDPIGANTELDLRRYVLSASPPFRNLWVGGHTVEAAGGGKTTVACPLAGRLKPAPLDRKFYNHAVAPVTGAPSTYANNVGQAFTTLGDAAQLTGVQFWRSTGSGPITVHAWQGTTNPAIATATAQSGFGWNEIYFPSPVTLAALTGYTVAWYVPAAGTFVVRSNRALSATHPDTGVTLAKNLYPSPSGLVDDFPYTHPPDYAPRRVEPYDLLVGPIINYEPEPPFEIFIVATAREDTDAGVHILRTEEGEGVIDIYWSASSANVAANVFVMASDPHDQGCEHVNVIGVCVDDDEEPPGGARMITPGLKVWRRQKLAKKYPDGKVSPHFRYSEFACRDGTPVPASDVNLKALERHCLMLLEPLRAKFGACHVMSGYRHRRYNASIGGATDSFHIWDDEKRRPYPATDLIFATGSPSKWGAEARRLMLNANSGNGGVGIYTRQGFVHVDLRPYVANWRGS